MDRREQTSGPVSEMTDLQLLTYLLELSGVEGGAARSTAHSLLDSYDSLATVISLPSLTLLEDPRLDENAGTFLALVGAMSSRYANRFHRSDLVVTDQDAVSALLTPIFSKSSVEQVCVICVDSGFHLLGSGAVPTHGDPDSVAFPVDRVLSLALSSGAYGIILAHSHPDGLAQFSAADLMTTAALRAKLAILDISLLDHYLWTAQQMVSLYALLQDPAAPPPLDRWNGQSNPLLSRFPPKAARSKRSAFVRPSSFC